MGWGRTFLTGRYNQQNKNELAAKTVVYSYANFNYITIGITHEWQP